jgi:ABC-type transport system involved in Fe-S cluster assembly fused permease/ATPase subunit
VTLFNNQKLEVNQYCKLFQDFQLATNKTEMLAALLNGGQAVILAFGMCGAMLSAVMLGRGGMGATPGDLVMIQGLLLQLWAPLQFLGWLYRELKNSLVDVEEFLDILRTKSNVVDGTKPLLLSQPSSSSHQGSNGTSSAFGGLEIDLDNVHFGYQTTRKILNGVSIKVHQGQSIAIVGPSGSGKSTLLKLLTRQYDVDPGSSVRLNGQDIRDLQLDSLRQSIAVVPQDTVLFNDTILQNIRYGRAEASDSDVMSDARLARLDEAVAKMPKQYETLVGERGLKLSGGEKQRVAIARAFLREPRLLICDEATSALDSESEAKIIESLDELAQGRTSIFVAHRLSTIRGCDRIIVLKDGVVVEEGSHAQLLGIEGGLFKQMWEQQVAEDGNTRSLKSESSTDSESDRESNTMNSNSQDRSRLLSLAN